MAVLASIAIPGLSSYIKKYSIEKEVTMLFSDISEQRLKSMEKGDSYGILFNSNREYLLVKFLDSNYNLKVDSDEELIPIKRVDLKYPLSKKGGNLEGTIILFDNRGIARTANWGLGGITIFINYPARINCIIASPTSIKLGKWDENTSECKPR